MADFFEEYVCEFARRHTLLFGLAILLILIIVVVGIGTVAFGWDVPAAITTTFHDVVNTVTGRSFDDLKGYVGENF